MKAPALHVTKHAGRQVRRRCGLPKRALKRAAGRALAEGLTLERAQAADRDFLEFHQHRHLAAYPGTDPHVRLHRGVCFVFVAATLVSCWRQRSEPEEGQ